MLTCNFAMQLSEERNATNFEQMPPPREVADRERTPSDSQRGGSKSSSWREWCATWVARLSPSARCPAPTPIHTFVTYLEICFILVALVYVLGLLPWAQSVRKPVSQLAVLGAVAWAFGHVAAFAHMPPLLGMLLAGMLLRNIGFFYAQGSFQDFVATLRLTAMAVILLKAGLGLDAGALQRLSMAVLRLAVCPCCVEAIFVSIIAHSLLGFPWMWGLLLGCVLGAVSPAVVVPSLLDLKARGYGEDKGISTLVIAASSIDDIIAISMFGVFLSAIFSEGSLIEQLLHGPVEVLLGLCWGVFLGVISIYVPHRDADFVVGGRLIMLGGGGLLAVLGSPLLGYAGAGPLGCIICAFVASYGWKNLGKRSSYVPVMDYISRMWLLVQPLLFGLIGTEVDLLSLDGHVVGFGLVILFTGLVVRLLTSAIVVQGAGLSPREVLFVSIAWLPKATVQATIGPVALDLARRKGSEEKVLLAHTVLTVAVLSILATAPLGAVGILWSGPKLLNRRQPADIVPQNTLVPVRVDHEIGSNPNNVVAVDSDSDTNSGTSLQG